MINEIKKAREELGISQRQLAIRLDLPPQRISEIETGKSNPGRKTLERIAKELKKDWRLKNG